MQEDMHENNGMTVKQFVDILLLIQNVLEAF